MCHDDARLDNSTKRTAGDYGANCASPAEDRFASWWPWLEACVCGCCVGEENVEKNTSQAFVETTGPVAGALAPTGEVGTPLFLINLCASMAPVQLASKSLPGLEAYRLYQVTRVEDGRTRYRLRLGFFASEAEAEEVLVKVREQYPTAFTACLCEEDRRHTRGYVVTPRVAKPAISVVPSRASAPKKPTTEPLSNKSTSAPPARTKNSPSAAAIPAAGSKPAPAKPASSNKAPPTSTIEVTWEREKSTRTSTGAKTPSIGALTGLDEISWESTTGKQPALPASNTRPAAPVQSKSGTAPKTEPKRDVPTAKLQPKHDAAQSMRVKALDLTLSDPPPPPVQKAAAPSNQPFHVGKGIDIPTTQLSLQSEVGAAASAKSAARTPAASTAARSVTSGALKTPATKSANAQSPAMPSSKAATIAKHPDLDSTQTIRALTTEELNDESQEKVFAIQLAASEQPVNLDAMPHLDIFEAYRLYSVATAGSGKIIHSLRLGFFKEAVSAEAVAGYLKTFFSSPTVLRISVAEQARFKDATLPKKPEPVETKATVVELNSARSARVPTVTMEVMPGGDTSATGSFKMNATGSFRTSDTATHRALTPAMKPAAKNAAPATKRSPPIARKKTATTGKYKAPQKKSLAEQLLEEAKEVELSESGIFKMQKSESSLLSRLVDKLKK